MGLFGPSKEEVWAKLSDEIQIHSGGGHISIEDCSCFSCGNLEICKKREHDPATLCWKGERSR